VDTSVWILPGVQSPVYTSHLSLLLSLSGSQPVKRNQEGGDSDQGGVV
jgi:hypothetical protein